MSNTALYPKPYIENWHIAPALAHYAFTKNAHLTDGRS